MRLFFSLLLLAAASTVAQAADLRRPVAPATVVEYGWQGLYAGVNGGANLGSFSPVFGTGDEAKTVNLDDNSAFVGGHISYLVQSGGLVIGPELGLQYWGFKSEGQVIAADPKEESPAVLLQQKVDWLVYANVRVGITPFAGVLAYVTGGAAWAHVSGELINVAELNTAFDQSVLGWNVGAGLEYKITERIVLGGEYRHYDFGRVSPGNPTLVLLGLSPDKLQVDQVMGRLSLRIN